MAGKEGNMNTLLDAMMKKYDPHTMYEKKNVMKEVMQEIVLCGLSRAGFFKKAAFYGGTALRIFYGLDRFSEDLDFSLMAVDEDFDITPYFPILQKEIAAFNLRVQLGVKDKTKSSQIRSAFLKGNTKEHLLLFYPEDVEADHVPANEVIKIKFEIDVNPPSYATFERKYRLIPLPYEVNLYDEASLFAGKIHAVIGRSWRNRIKGRDLYDYVFYLSRNTEVNIRHLQARLIQSGHFADTQMLTLDGVKQLLCERFTEIDFEQAKADVLPFIKDTTLLNLWSADFFQQITTELKENRT
jgi:predicted nucleotidyltransferase component of viral defense system